MKVEQVPCGECGILIPEITAQRTRGLCVPCKMRLTKGDPFQDLDKTLTDRVERSSNGFETLSEPEKLYFALKLLRDEVQDGGFQQYFSSHSGSFYEYAEKGLTAVGARRLLELLRQAKESIFPGTSVPVDTEERRRLLWASPSASAPASSAKMDELEKRFSADCDSLSSRLKIFARQTGLVPEHA